MPTPGSTPTNPPPPPPQAKIRMQKPRTPEWRQIFYANPGDARGDGYGKKLIAALCKWGKESSNNIESFPYKHNTNDDM